MASRSLKNRPDIKKKSPFVGFLVVLSTLAVVCVAGFAGVWALGESWLKDDLPSYENIDEYNTALKTKFTAVDPATGGQIELASLQLENREPVTLDQISPYVLEGTVATEDVRFYDHTGFDPLGIARALFVNLSGSSREGASTITQQLVRNTILSDEATDISIKRKVREVYLSMKVEEKYSKDELLLMYLNTINYGSATYGIQAAAQRYFSKDAIDLTLVESATLIGIPQSPTYNSPIDHPDTCLARRNVVLSRMQSNGFITQEEYDVAVVEPLVLNETPPSQDFLYPYFTSYVKDVMLDLYSEAEILQGGYTVETSLDIVAQEAAEAAAADKRAEVDGEFQVALTAIDPETGFVKAIVGGTDFEANPWNLATQEVRQPGSSFKTFTLIAALEAGISPQTLIDCSTTAKFPGWEPSNINHRNFGTISMARAFEVSSNTGFARLIMALTPDKVAEVAKRMGINQSTLVLQPTMTLGSEAVTTLEMAQAYATIANGGVQRNATPIVRILDKNGDVIIDNTVDLPSVQALTPEIASAATKVMTGVVSGYNGTGGEAALRSGQPVAGKTGTSETYMDSWFAGFTPQLAVAMWLGDARGYEKGEALPSSVTVTSVFSDFVGTVLKGQPIEQFKTAPNPPYKPYTNTKYGIGGTAYSYRDSDTEEKEEKKTETPTPKPEATPTPTPTPTPTSPDPG